MRYNLEQAETHLMLAGRRVRDVLAKFPLKDKAPSLHRDLSAINLILIGAEDLLAGLAETVRKAEIAILKADRATCQSEDANGAKGAVDE